MRRQRETRDERKKKRKGKNTKLGNVVYLIYNLLLVVSK
jgi:hypothetical protein